MPAGKSVKLLGVRLDAVTWADIEAVSRQALAAARPLRINTVNGEIILAADRDPSYRAVLNTGDLNIADSTNVVWVSGLTGQNLPGRLPGVDCLDQLCQLASDMDKSVFLLGARPGVATEAAAVLQKKYPSLIIAGVSAADPTDPTVCQQIRAAKAAILFVAYGAPTQELWIDRHKDETGAIIHLGVGGSFDMLSGRLPRAPKFFRALSLEWLWRLALEPKRFVRIWRAVVVFPLKALIG